MLLEFRCDGYIFNQSLSLTDQILEPKVKVSNPSHDPVEIICLLAKLVCLTVAKIPFANVNAMDIP